MIVVTGGAGFIGSILVSTFEAKGARIAVVDRLRAGSKWRNLAKRALAALVAPDDLFPFLDAHAAEIELVCHMGAISTTTELDADLVVHTNFGLSQRIWDWCATHGTRLIYASSAATYGDGTAGFDDDIDALAQLGPLNVYGWSKHLFDRWIAGRLAAGKSRPPQWVGLKFFNVYGPNEYHKGRQRSVAHQIFEDVRAGRHASLFRSYDPAYPDGGQLRDFVYVDDVARVVEWLVDHPEVSGLFNVGSGEARSFMALATAVFAALGEPPDIRTIDMPEQIRGQYQYRTEASMARLRAAGYDRPMTGLEDGVRDYVTRYLATDDPYR